MTRISEVIATLEEFAPGQLQESYDNSGLLTGNPEWAVKGILVSLDVTEAVIEEAIEKKCNMIVSHHPIIFGGLKKLTGSNYVERCVILALKNDIALYACHTNLDSVHNGVNAKIAEKIGLQNVRMLDPLKGNLRKLVTFVPLNKAEAVRQAIFDAGAGHIGNYDHCSFNMEGTGTFRGNEETDPYVGEPLKEHHEKEVRIELIYRKAREKAILRALLESHPYEEVAYDIYPLENADEGRGIGMIGELEKGTDLKEFLTLLKDRFSADGIRYTHETGKQIRKIAICGGSGSFLIGKAIAAGADAFVTGDIKYHQFFDADGKIVLVDIGHFESEQFTVELLGSILNEKFDTFATYFSCVNTNPIKYF